MTCPPPQSEVLTGIAPPQQLTLICTFGKEKPLQKHTQLILNIPVDKCWHASFPMKNGYMLIKNTPTTHPKPSQHKNINNTHPDPTKKM